MELGFPRWNWFCRPDLRKWNSYQPARLQTRETLCTHCGIFSNGHRHNCKAIHSKCYKCGHFGHYARLCRTKFVKSHVCKSEKRKQRDLHRLLKFNEKKSVMALFPFSDLDGPEFNETMRTMDNTLRTELSVIKKRSAEFTKAFWDTDLELAKTKFKLESSESKIKELSDRIETLCSPHAALIKKHEEEKSQLNQEIRKVRTQYVLKIREVNNLTMDIQEYARQIMFKDKLIDEFKLKLTEYFGLYKQHEKDSLHWKDKYEQMCKTNTENTRRKRGNRK